MSDKSNFLYYSADLDATDIHHKTRKQLAELHEEAKLGDRQAWEDLWLYGTKLVLKIVNKLAEEDLLALSFEDAVAEGNLAIGEALVRWKPSQSSFGTWIWIRIRGSVLNENAKEQKSGMIGDLENSPVVLPNESAQAELLSDLYEAGQTKSYAETGAVYGELYEAIQTLPPREKQYLIAVFFEDRDQAEIAALEGISKQMVGRVIQRGLDKLFLLLGGLPSEDYLDNR